MRPPFSKGRRGVSHAILLAMCAVLGLAMWQDFMSNLPSLLKEEEWKNGHVHNDTADTPVLIDNSSTVERARQFVLGRQEAYRAMGYEQNWKLRGVGYLYHHHQIILNAELPAKPTIGLNSIKIENVYNATDIEKRPRDDCHLLTIWVRVNGPEIFAGKATSAGNSTSSCYWQYDFDLQVEGPYSVDAKVLLWNGDAPIGGTHESQCEFYEGDSSLSPDQSSGLIYTDFQGFKMYRPIQMCCEICSRLSPHCRYWATPPRNIAEPHAGLNGCELFFDEHISFDIIPISHLLFPPHEEVLPQATVTVRQPQRRLEDVLFAHGPAHSNPTSYFVGCGWSFWFSLDFPCLSGDLDDKVFISDDSFEFTRSSDDTHPSTGSKIGNDRKRLCTHLDERVDRSKKGRWVRKEWPDAETCPSEMSFTNGTAKQFDITVKDGRNPLCWHRDDLTRVGQDCFEMNCRHVPQSSKWISSLHRENEWFGVWRSYDCDYVEFTDSELQQCIDKRKISSIRTWGHSIASFINEFLDHRLANITLYDSSDPESIEVSLDTLSMLHKSGPDGSFANELYSRKTVPKNVERNFERYWTTGFFLSSEREVHTHVARIEQYNQLAQSILAPKGYKMINTFDMTAAFTYDTATQMDGMHIIGPPMKMIVTKLFHHMCAGVVDGTRV